MIKHEEDITSDFEGTVIDIETVGGFLNQYHDSRRYKNIRLVIFGFINSNGLCICCAKGMEALTELNTKTEELIELLQKPFYAFNCEFERSVLFYMLGRKIDFGRELNNEKYESKANAVQSLRIPNYDDPFNDNGKLCMTAWEQGEYDKAIVHNRACLLKERDILIKRAFREPDEMIFVDGKQ